MELQSKSQIRALLRQARATVMNAQSVRGEHRRRRRESRAEDLVGALAMLDLAMQQVRPLIHASTRREVPCELELREVSDAIQRERRKLRKMLDTTNRREGIFTIEGGWS